jgi:thiamine pyrophosphate-dependent acetolactate synthase large subunit-like protein
MAERVTTCAELEAALRRAMSHRRPHLLELLTPYEECLPLMPPGKSFNEMIVEE